MNKKFKKVLVVLLSALMVFTYMPTMAFAAEGDPVTTYTVQSPSIPDQEYTESEDELNGRLKSILSTITVDGNLILREGTDFTVKASTIQPTTNPEEPALAMFTTMGNYADAKINPLPFKIVTASAADTYEATIDESGFVYGCGVLNAQKVKPAIQVIKNGNTEVTDFAVAVTAPQGAQGNAGEKYTAKVSVPDATSPVFEKTFEITIAKKDIAGVALTGTGAPSLTYDGTAKEATFTAVNGQGVTLAAADFDITGYENNVNATSAQNQPKAKITVKSTCQNYTGSGEVPFRISPLELQHWGTIGGFFTWDGIDVVFPRDIVSVVFNGKAQTPELGETVYVSHEDRNAPVLPKSDYEFVYTNNVNAGNKTVSLRAKSANVTGQQLTVPYNLAYPNTYAYVITPADMKDVTVTLKEGVKIVVDTDVTQNFSQYFDVKLGDYVLTNSDYRVAYTQDHHNEFGVENVLTLTARGNNFTGTTTATYVATIKPLAAKYTSNYSATFNGEEQRPSVNRLGRLTRKTGETTGEANLTANDYKVLDWSENINAGTAIATIEGLGDYEGQTAEVEFTINPAQVANNATLTVTGIEEGTFYEGMELPNAVVTIGGQTLQPTADDYTVTVDHISGGYLTRVRVEFKRNFTGSARTVNVNVVAHVASFDDATVSETIPAGLSNYNAAAIKNFLTVTIDGQEVTKSSYNVERINAPATVTVGSQISFTLTSNVIGGTKTATVTVVERDINELADGITVANGGTYDGKAKKPVVTIRTPDQYTRALVLDTDYTLTYTDNVDAGTATVTIAGKGNYKGSVSKTFTIAKLQLTQAMFEVVKPSAADRQFKVGPAVDLSSKMSLKATEAYKDLKFAAEDYTIVIDPDQTVEEGDQAASKFITYKVLINKDSKNYVENSTGFATSYALVPRTVTDATVTVTPSEFELETDGEGGAAKPVSYYLDKATTKVEVVVDGNTLLRGRDYTVTGKGDNKLPSEYPADHTYEQPYAEISFQGNYVGINNSAKISIVAKIIDLSNIKLVPPTEAELIYSGRPVVVQANDIGREKLDPRSWTVVYTDAEGKEVEPVNVGTYKATVKATADYGDKEGESIEFTITPQILTADQFQAKVAGLSHRTVEYLGQSTKAPVIEGPEADQFEVVSYDKEWDGDPASKGKATIALKAGANYKYDGSAEKTFSWKKGDLFYEDVNDWFEIAPQTYTGLNLEPAVTAKADLSAAYVDVKYYENNVNSGIKTAKAYVVVTIPNSEKKYEGYMQGYIVFTINPAGDLQVEVKNATYTGKALEPAVTVKNAQGVLLDLDKDYTVAYENNINAGEGNVTVTAMGNYTGSYPATFTIAKAKNPMKVSAKAVSAKAKKTVKIAAKKAFKFSKKAQGKVTYKLAKKAKNIKVAKNGKITVKKGLKKGKTIKIKVKVTAKGNANYKKAVKTLTVKIKIK